MSENLSLLRLPEQKQRIVVKSEDKRLVYAEVYSPLHVDTDGEAMTQDEIEKAAHNFLASGNVRNIDVRHNTKQSGCVIVESFMARKGDPDGFIEGSWVMGVKVLPDDLWQKVLSGELNGFSFMGQVTRVPVKAKVKVARKMLGETELSVKGMLPPHFHELVVTFDERGRVEPGETDESLSHKHEILRATATEKELDHSHRLILIDNEEPNE